MNRLISYIKICRTHQWYKNLVIFLPLLFVSGMIAKNQSIMLILGFVSLALISSSNYIINDIADLKKDKHHPEKRMRPLAAGKITVPEAGILAALLAIASLFLAYKLNIYFFYSVILLFVLTQIYTFFLKNEVFLDILLISTNFVIRAASGAFILSVVISPWLILCTFFLAMFLAVSKRYADLLYLGNKATKHKEVLAHYSKELTNVLMIISTVLLIMSYSLYSFLSSHKYLLVTLPIALYVIFRYFYLVYSGSEISRHPDKMIKDGRLVTGVLVLLIALIFLLHFVK